MIYNLTSDTGTVVVAPSTTIAYKGLSLIGRDSVDWNQPIQQNFVALADEVDLKADASSVTAIDTRVTAIEDYSGFVTAFDAAK